MLQKILINGQNFFLDHNDNEKLNHLLHDDRYLKNNFFAEIWISRPNSEGASISLLSNKKEGRAFLMFLRENGDPGFSSRAAETFSSLTESETEFFLDNGQREKYPIEWTVPLEQGFKALGYFLTNEKMASWINWHDDSNGQI